MMGCFFMTSYSSGVSLPEARRMASSMPILPMSWSSAAYFDVARHLVGQLQLGGQTPRLDAGAVGMFVV